MMSFMGRITDIINLMAQAEDSSQAKLDAALNDLIVAEAFAYEAGATQEQTRRLVDVRLRKSTLEACGAGVEDRHCDNFVG